MPVFVLVNADRLLQPFPNISDSASSPSPQLFFETIKAFQKTGALAAALELSVFTAIGPMPSSAVEIATLCQCPLRGIRILCDYLTILGFLIKEADRYTLTPSTAVFLDKNSPAYLGDSVQFFLAPGIADGFNDLAATIRNGRVHTSERGTTSPDNPVWIEFARAMGPMMVPAAQGAAALVSLDQERDTRVLDISASHGTYGIVFARQNPRAHLVALDWEAVLVIADAFTVDLGSDYDVVLVPNFLHHFSLADCTAFLRRVHAALRPGGKVVIVEFVPNEDRVTPAAAAGFSLVMLGTTPEGDAYTFAEYRQMLADAGFRDASLHPLPPTAESAVIATA